MTQQQSPFTPQITERALRILVVEKDARLRELLVGTLSQFGFTCEPTLDCETALETIHDATNPDPAQPAIGLVICDVRMPDRDGVWLLDRLREDHPDVAVIMLTAIDRSPAAIECLRGATDYLVKPIDMDELLVAVDQALERRRLLLENRAYQNHLERMVDERTAQVQQALGRLRRSYSETMSALAAALDAREQETANHSERVSNGCVRLLRSLGVTDEGSLKVIQMGAMLHDIGKIGIPDRILLKPGPLDNDEWEIMRQHPLIGYEILKEIHFLEPSLDLVLYHQERFDGTGYPYGLTEDQIPLSARAFAVVDAWDAMTNQRPYRDPLPGSQAVIELLRCAGKHFDPQAVDVFCEQVRRDGYL